MRMTEVSMEKLLEEYRAKINACLRRCVLFFEAVVSRSKNGVDGAFERAAALPVWDAVHPVAVGLRNRTRKTFTPVVRFLRSGRKRLWPARVKPAFLRRWEIKPRGVLSTIFNGFLRVPVVVVWLIATVAIAGLVHPAVPVRVYAVKDPNASYFDVSARREFLQQTESPVLRALMAPRGISLSTSADQLVAPIEGVYSVPRHYVKGTSTGEINPEYVAAVKPLWQFREAVNDIARLYVISGDPAYAQLLVEFLDGWAGADSLTEHGNKQGWYSITWATVDAGLSYSIVRDEPSLDPAAKGRVEAWLHQVADNNIAEPGALDYPNSDGRNNISYWRGLEATVVGKVTEDLQMFDWGIDTFKRALDDMNADGSFPGEMARGEGALRYQHFATKPLVLIAEVAARQGYDLYSLEVGGRSLHTAAAFSVAAIKDRSLIRRYTREPQRFTSKRGLSWAEVYYRRFPRPELEEFIGKGTLASGAMRRAPLLTLYFYPAFPR